MEMVSAAKSRRLVDRLNTTKPYENKLSEMIRELGEEKKDIHSPYLSCTKKLSKIALLVLSANRGLCGAYNTNVLRLTQERYEELSFQGIKCDLYVIGKKGNSYFKFVNLPIKESYVDIEENFTYAQSEELTLVFMKKFREEIYEKVEFMSTVYHSAGSQKAECIDFLPLRLKPPRLKKEEHNSKEKESSPAKEKPKLNHILEPDSKSIIEALLPLSLKIHFYRILLEAMCSEQIARRIAMKNATEAAGEMLKSLVRSYNRTRQASITQELAEIVAGADAI